VIKRGLNFSKAPITSVPYQNWIDSLRMNKIDWYSVQLSALDDHFYSVINIAQSSTIANTYGVSEQIKSKSIALNSNTISASLVKNHTTNSNEILLQDSSLSIQLISMSEGLRWKKQFKEKTTDWSGQLDFYKNNKYQFILSTSNEIHLIDRLGRFVSGFPISSLKGINYLSVVDYDRTKNYRYLIALEKEIYLVDKNGANLTEWGPKKFSSKINSKPVHFKMGGKDYFLVFTDDNSVHIYNRKGLESETFKLKEELVGEYYLEPGLTPEKSLLFFVTKDGLLIKQNLKGEVISSENLPRGKNSNFLMRVVDGDASFYIARMDSDKVVLFDKTGKLILELANNGSMKMDMHISNTGGSLVFCLFDAEQKMASVFNQSGKNLTLSPIDSDIMPLVSFDKARNERGIYYFPGRKVVYTKID
jgi:hypothetical protein